MNDNGSDKCSTSIESKITSEEFEEIWSTTLPLWLKDEINSLNLRYVLLTSDERDNYIREVIDLLSGDGVPVAGEHRLSAWETGWSENLEMLRKTGKLESLLPKYHGKHKLVHWRQKIVRPLSPNFDYEIHRALLDWGSNLYLGGLDHVFEFGCGPAYHMLRIKSTWLAHTLSGLIGLKPLKK